jgi:hypothetical protein
LAICVRFFAYFQRRAGLWRVFDLHLVIYKR